MTRPKVLLLGKIDHAPAQADFDALSSLADLVKPTATHRAAFIEECKSGQLDGVVAIFRTFGSVSITGLIDEELVRALPKSVKFLCHNGAGYDQISVPACTSRHIHVSNVSDPVNSATADTAVFLILGALRLFNAPMGALRHGLWRGNPPPPLGNDPEGKVLGILGMGGIGRLLARKMRGAFEMRVQYYNRKPLSEEDAEGARYVSFEELLRTSDVLSLNLPLNPHTRHIISHAQFAVMKPGIVLINTARGAVVDEAALVEALTSGTVASVGLDVFEDEPEVHPGLVDNEKVILLPHMGTWTVETQTKMERWCVANVREALEQGRLKSQVAEQAGLGYK